MPEPSALTYPWDKEPATVGNGTMVALEAKDKDQVHRLYKIAIAEGGTDEGPPGPRGDGFYAAYFRDLDGNKLNAFFMG
ncbi:MAG: VOC family protein [Hyphomonas sp.]